MIEEKAKRENKKILVPETKISMQLWRSMFLHLLIEMADKRMLSTIEIKMIFLPRCKADLNANTPDMCR